MIREVDIAIIGGAFSGSSFGLLVKRARPETSVLIVEKSTVFDRKVGESTSEVAGCFLTRVLGLDAYLGREHITKHGLRMWFTDDDNDCMGKCSEIGAYYQVRLPTFQLDRSKLDSHLLDLAVDAGCELIRPGTIRDLQLAGHGQNSFTVKTDAGSQTVHAKWVIDASGKAATIARQLGHWRALDDHPINSIWSRFRNVADFDSWELRQRFPEYADAVRGPRGSATNHLMGHGWWSWIIPLSNGEVSAGLTWDPRLFTPPGGASLAERLKRHLVGQPVGREIFGDAEPVQKDTRTYTKLPYYTERAMGDGWASVGDAAGFMDPLYSQGLDYCAHTVYATHKLVLKSLDANCVAADADAYSAEYRESYFRWYRALYKDKYQYLGDAELMHAAFLLDIGTYFIGPVRLVYENPDSEFRLLPYNGLGGLIFARFMALYNRRLARLARRRLAAGSYGSKNLGERYLISEGFAPCKRAATSLILRGTRIWLQCELKALFLPDGRRSPGPTKELPIAAAAPTP